MVTWKRLAVVGLLLIVILVGALMVNNQITNPFQPNCQEDMACWNWQADGNHCRGDQFTTTTVCR